jgi:hypothetical protein
VLIDTAQVSDSVATLSEPQHFLQLGLYLLLTFPAHHANVRMKLGFEETVKEITLANRWSGKPIGRVQDHRGLPRLASESETGQHINGQTAGVHRNAPALMTTK